MLVADVVAILEEHGIHTEETTSDGVLAALRLHMEHAEVTAEYREERRQRIALVVAQLAIAGYITEKEVDAATARALSDETYLDELRERPPMPPGVPPVAEAVTPREPTPEPPVGPARWNPFSQAWERCEAEITRHRQG
jgi:hypothetical protein